MSAVSDSIVAARVMHEAKFPQLGLEEAHYIKAVGKAEAERDWSTRATNKVGLYLTRGLTPRLRWQKAKECFEHALHNHCRPPANASADDVVFAKALTDFACEVAGNEALRRASAKDDLLAARRANGDPAGEIEADAERFFGDLLGYNVGYSGRAPIFREKEFSQLIMIRDQWL